MLCDIENVLEQGKTPSWQTNWSVLPLIQARNGAQNNILGWSKVDGVV